MGSFGNSCALGSIGVEKVVFFLAIGGEDGFVSSIRSMMRLAAHSGAGSTQL